MASLDPGKVSHLRRCLEACNESYLLAAVDHVEENAKALKGSLGVIDWRLHGAISRLTKEPFDSFTLMPHNRLLGKASLLLFRADQSKCISELPQVLKKINAERICVAESTMSPSLFSSIEQQLKKANVTWSKLEELA